MLAEGALARNIVRVVAGAVTAGTRGHLTWKHCQDHLPNRFFHQWPSARTDGRFPSEDFCGVALTFFLLLHIIVWFSTPHHWRTEDIQALVYDLLVLLLCETPHSRLEVTAS